MNREIKFRGIRIDTVGMIYGSLCKGIHEGTMCIMPNTFFGTVIFTDEEETKYNREEDGLALGGWFGVKPETVGQFINEKDKNDIDVFEGDLVEIKTNYHTRDKTFGWQVLEIFHDGYGFKGTNKEGHVYDLYDETDEGSYNWEVIGNIHQNSELLCK